MKIFFDSEFTGLHQFTSLISIGFVDEGINIFYAEFNDFHRDQIDDRIKENVIENTIFKGRLNDDNNQEIGDFILDENDNEAVFYGSTEFIKIKLEKWLKKYDSIEIWSDCLAYDWVLFNQLWENAVNIPKNINYIPFDICTLFKIKNINPDINREEFVKDVIDINNKEKHNALWDAIVIKACYYKLMNL